MKYIILALLFLNIRIIYRVVAVTFIAKHEQFTDSVKTMLSSVVLCSFVTSGFCLYELQCSTPSTNFQFVALLTLYSVVQCEVLYIVSRNNITEKGVMKCQS